MPDQDPYMTHEFAGRRTWGPSFNCARVLEYVPPNQDFTVIAGPCSVESPEQIAKLAEIVSAEGATHLRGGVFRAGTYPGKSFGYIGEEFIKAFHSAARKHGLKNIIEVLDYSEGALDMVAKYADCFQVGARSQQNYTLLRSLGYYKKPVFLKRHPGSTVDEWLGSAEHLLAGGVQDLYLIERGSSTFHTDVRWTPCVHTIPSVQSMCAIPVIMDASHGSGRRDLVPAMTFAGVAAGANGILLEVHEKPSRSLSDADQAITPETFKKIMKTVGQIRQIVSENEML